MPEKIEREVNDDSLDEELERERREHALIDEEKLGMDELEEERLKRERQPGTPAAASLQADVSPLASRGAARYNFALFSSPSPGGP